MQTVLRGMWGTGGVSEYVRKLDGWRRSLLAVIAGGLYALAFPPFNFFPLLFIIFPLLILAIDHSKSIISATKFGWFFGFGHFLAGNYWIGLSFLAQDGVPVWMAPLAVAALAGVLAIYTGLSFGLARARWPSGWQRFFVFASIWTIFEWLRGTLFTGFPWNQSANIWAGSDAMIQSVAYIGSYGLGFLTVLIGVAFASFVESGNHNRIRTPALAIGVMSLVFALGFFRLAMAESIFHAGAKNPPGSGKYRPNRQMGREQEKG